MFPTRMVLALFCVSVFAQDEAAEQAAKLKALVQQAPRFALVQGPIPLQPPQDGWEVGMVSWVTVDRKGLIYMLQRGPKADPVIVLNREGRVLRSWGKGLYVMPHAIRIDPQGNVWTADAASSKILKFTPEGKLLLEIEVGGQPTPCRNNFCGTTDVSFAPNGHIYIADGYANARVLEYTADGRKVREWGEPGTGPGQFRLVHSVQVDESGTVYVADRENGRIQWFTPEGRYVGEWSHLGKTFSLTFRKGELYISTQPRNQPNFSPGWLMKVDRKSGKILGYVDSIGNHGVAATDDGEILIGPGPNQAQWYRKKS